MYNVFALFLMLICYSAMSSASADFDDGMAAFQQGSYDAVLREWRPLAEAGHVGAQVGLGLMYATGKGVLEDDTEAEQWLRRNRRMTFIDQDSGSQLLLPAECDYNADEENKVQKE